ALMLPGIIQNQANGTLAHFGGIFVRRLAHDAPSYSRVGASDKPGAVQRASSDSGVIRRIPPGFFNARDLIDCDTSPCQGTTGRSASRQMFSTRAGFAPFFPVACLA
ncbi:MAG TPA: hypothetical protein ENK41_04095, partial [Rhodobacteraceae bacterium]|nr:hypothetical protein [Paracoccaceae bacterium]